MTFLILLLGIVIGMLAITLVTLGQLLDKNGNLPDNVVRTMKEVTRKWMPEKGHIIYPKSDDVIAMEEMFERNDKKGEDTKIGEIEG